MNGFCPHFARELRERVFTHLMWLDASLSETSRDELVDTLVVPERALEGRSRVRADAQSVDFALRCYVAMERPADKGAYRLRRSA